MQTGFFPHRSPDENDQTDPPRQPWYQPPQDELPALYAISELIASTDRVAIALVGARAYSDGVEFIIERRLRRGDIPFAQWQQVHTEFVGHWPGTSWDDQLQWGLVLSDGQRLHLDPLNFPLAETPTGHVLSRTGGSGGGGSTHYSVSDGLWLWPLPTEGPIELVMQWPAYNIPETHIALDSTPIRQLATRTRPLWHTGLD